MRDAIQQLLREALLELAGRELLPPDAVPASVTIERTRDPSHGDFAANVAMTLARAARRTPRELATQIVDALPPSPLVATVDIAGPGFINFHLSDAARHEEIRGILERGEAWGRSKRGEGRRVLVEFISANPTGPLHVGHGRHAAYGASVANLLDATGYEVEREYYVNDAGRQMDILAISLWMRYLGLAGETVPFPAAGYRGDYVVEIAQQLLDAAGAAYTRPAAEVVDGLPPDGERREADTHVDALIERGRSLLGADAWRELADMALAAVLEDIRDDLEQFGIGFDRWFSERALFDEGRVRLALDELEQRGELYEREGATWFRASRYGDEKDRVVVRENGQTTYIASDIAYHFDKRKRGTDLMLDVLGSDHHGYVARVRAGLVALDQPADSLEVRLVQFVTLYRGGEKVQMSTRSGQFITLRELRDDVGNDAARLFYVMRSNDQHLNFDIDLARSRTEENPVYYIQYAHARVCNVFRKLGEQSLAWNRQHGSEHLDLLDNAHERRLFTELSRYPEVVELAADNRAPHHLVHYLRDLANHFHTYYNASRFIVDDDALRDARLTLIAATRQVIANGLGLLGVSAPESM